MSVVTLAQVDRLATGTSSLGGTIRVSPESYTTVADQRLFTVIDGTLLATPQEPAVVYLHEVEAELQFLRTQIGDTADELEMTSQHQPRESWFEQIHQRVGELAHEYFERSRVTAGTNDLGMQSLTIVYVDETSEVDVIADRIIALHERIQEAFEHEAESLPAIYVRAE